MSTTGLVAVMNSIPKAIGSNLNLNFNLNAGAKKTRALWIIGSLFLLAVGVWLGVVVWANWTKEIRAKQSTDTESSATTNKSACPTLLTRDPTHGTLRLDTGETFPDMNAFQQWWHSTNADGPDTSMNGRCAIPVLEGEGGGGGESRETSNGRGGWSNEQMSATTPINKLDDYEFSRIFGYEKGGHMIVPRQDFNLILEKRAFDWADMPLTSSEREGKHAGLVEGFVALGAVGGTASVSSQQEARSRYGEKGPNEELSGVEGLVQRAYQDDPDWMPVLTRVGPNQWEVNTLNPRRQRAEPGRPGGPVDERVVNTQRDEVDVQFQYRQDADRNTALDSESTSMTTSHSIFGPNVESESKSKFKPDYRGRMDLPFAPTFEHPGDWSVKAPGWN